MGDSFHDVFGGADWRQKWIGKVEGTINSLRGQACYCTIKGGKQCDWERQQLLRFQQLHPGIRIEHFDSMEDFVSFLQGRGRRRPNGARVEPCEHCGEFTEYEVVPGSFICEECLN